MSQTFETLNSFKHVDRFFFLQILMNLKQRTRFHGSEIANKYRILNVSHNVFYTERVHASSVNVFENTK